MLRTLPDMACVHGLVHVSLLLAYSCVTALVLWRPAVFRRAVRACLPASCSFKRSSTLSTTATSCAGTPAHGQSDTLAHSGVIGKSVPLECATCQVKHFMLTACRVRKRLTGRVLTQGGCGGFKF